eukprot:gene14620-biopygen1930
MSEWKEVGKGGDKGIGGKGYYLLWGRQPHPRHPVPGDADLDAMGYADLLILASRCGLRVVGINDEASARAALRRYKAESSGRECRDCDGAVQSQRTTARWHPQEDAEARRGKARSSPRKESPYSLRGHGTQRGA